MKILDLGPHAQKSSYHTWENGIMTGYSKTIEVGDVLAFDPKLQSMPHMVTALQKRDHKGKFKNPENAKNAFFRATVRPLTDEEVATFRADNNLMTWGHWS